MNKTYISNFIQRRKGDNITFFFAVFFLILIRFLYFGFEYYPQLDDYIQHHNYAQLVEQMFDGNMGEFIKWIGLLSARPLAGLLDITLWSWLWPCAIIGVILICAMYAYASVLFLDVFRKTVGTTELFAVIFALLPLGIEGTYWLSASTRIVPGLLFTALSAKFFIAFLEKGKWYNVAISFLFQFLTFCFYEQTALLSCALNCIIGALYIRKTVKLRWIFAPMGIISALLYFTVVGMFGPSQLYDGRGSFFTSITPEYFSSFLPNLLGQMKSSFFGGGFYTMTIGFVRGIKAMFSDVAVIYTVCIIALSVGLGYLVLARDTKREAESKSVGRLLLTFAVGVALFVAPLVPFFVIDSEPWFSFRGTVPSFVGIALMCDALVRVISFKSRRVIAVLCSVISIYFCICSVSEISDYRKNHEEDMRIVAAVSGITKDHPDGGKIAILNLDSSYLDEMNCYYHEHISGVTESDWALTGAVRCYNEFQLDHISYIPFSLQKDPVYKGWEYSTKAIGTMNGVYWFDHSSNSLVKLNLVSEGDHIFSLYFENGKKYATVVETPSKNNPSQYEGRIFEEN